MGLIKEIKENKWGIILGGIWGLFTLLESTSGIAEKLFGIKIFEGNPIIIILTYLPALVIGGPIGIAEKVGLLKNVLPFELIVYMSPFTGMLLGYLINKSIERVIRK